ncbi:hypothetical protein O4H52_17315 [Sphingomonadaceae bacterium G21617-S1]|nr:hypothetical protein [Sphingomonadaceae bacterium G21617-S1]
MSELNTLEDNIESVLNSPEIIKESEIIRADILENLRSIERLIQQRIFLLFSLIILYELLFRGQISSVETLGFSINSSPLMNKIGPLGIAYAYFSTIMLITSRRVLEISHDQFFGHLFPNLFDVDMGIIVRPHQTMKTLLVISKYTSGLSKYIVVSTNIISASILVITPVGYIIYSSYRICIASGWDYISIGLALISMILSLSSIVILAIAGDTVVSDD